MINPEILELYSGRVLDMSSRKFSLGRLESYNSGAKYQRTPLLTNVR